MLLLRYLLIFLLSVFSVAAISESFDYIPPEENSVASMSSLSLHDAIMLSIRQNPNVQTAQLNHVLSKFSLEVAQWQFRPHFDFSATKTTTRTYSVDEEGYVSRNLTGFQPGVSLLTPFGTTLKATQTNDIDNHYYPGLSLNIEQPLMRGFGRPIVQAALFNAMDSEIVSRLNVENVLRNTVTSVINAYLDVLLARHTLEVDQAAFGRAQTSVRQTKLFIKAGHKAGVELVTASADVANAEARMEADKNNLQQTHFALLTAIGLDPNSKIKITDVNVAALIQKYQIPSLETAKKLILENDIQFQIDQITLNGTIKRSLLTAEDNTRWQLGVSANADFGKGLKDGKNSGLNNIINGTNQTTSATLKLTIPIDDKAAKFAVSSARIARHQAEVALKYAKWNKETSVINTWNNIYSAERSLVFAQNAEKLQSQTYNISFQKYSHGLIDSLELQTAEVQLRSNQLNVVNARINYLKSLVNFDQTIGTTLQTWDVKVKYL